ncbi:MAG: glycosyltransferase family 2 protein [Solirubrobacterales bacterium]|nr:glycosyltransferase family 2 protein [Solirubrobacterales bacterium]
MTTTDRRPAGELDWLGGHRVSVLLPALNEADNLKHVLPRIPTWVHEVVLIDDHCTDDTVEVARRLLPDIVIVPNERPGGKGNALRTGSEAATGDILVQVDTDGSEDPTEIHGFVGALLAGADYAKGSRFIQGGGTSDMPALRKWGNWALVGVVRCLWPGTKFTDLCYGYNGYWKRVAPLLLDAEGFDIETVMNLRAVRAGLRIHEVPSFEAERIHGEGKLLTWPDGWKVLKAIVRERRDKRVIMAPPAAGAAATLVPSPDEMRMELAS